MMKVLEIMLFIWITDFMEFLFRLNVFWEVRVVDGRFKVRIKSRMSLSHRRARTAQRASVHALQACNCSSKKCRLGIR